MSETPPASRPVPPSDWSAPSRPAELPPPGSDIAVALGGGGARGLTHIGVLRTLEAAGYRIRAVAGCSIGAIVGGIYCAGELDAYEEFVRGLTRSQVMRFLDPRLPTSGVFAGARLEQLYGGFVGERRIEELELPFAALVVDLRSGEELSLREGPLVRAMRASGSIPGLLRPVRWDGRWLIDGGVASIAPITAARELVDLPVVAVSVSTLGLGAPRGEAEVASAVAAEEREATTESRLAPLLEGLEAGRDAAAASLSRGWDRLRGYLGNGADEERARPPSMVEVLDAMATISGHHLFRHQLGSERPEAVITPRIDGVGLFDFHQAAALIAEGARSAREALDLPSTDPNVGGPEASRDGPLS